MPIGRRWLAGKDCVLISTKARSVARRACWHGCARWMPKTLARYPEREPVEREVADFLRLDAARFCSRTESMRRFICFARPISTRRRSASSSCPRLPCMRSSRKQKARASFRFSPVRTSPFPWKTASRISPRTRLIAVANPNNPTGAAVTCDVLLQVAQAAPQAAVLVDEAYFEFHGETILQLSASVRRISSWHEPSRRLMGLAGLRIGILAGDAGQMTMVRRVASPYNVNAVALAVLPEALQDQEYVERYVAEVQQRPRTSRAGTQNSRPALLAEPCQLCAGARRSRPHGIHSVTCARAESSCATGTPTRDAKAACA